MKKLNTLNTLLLLLAITFIVGCSSSKPATTQQWTTVSSFSTKNYQMCFDWMHNVQVIRQLPDGTKDTLKFTNCDENGTWH